MSDRTIAVVFEHDGDQVVALPPGYALPGTEVRVSRVGTGVLLEPLDQTAGDTTDGDEPARATPADFRALFAELDRLNKENGPFMPEGRQQPPMPPADDFPSFD